MGGGHVLELGGRLGSEDEFDGDSPPVVELAAAAIAADGSSVPLMPRRELTMERLVPCASP
ncbi:MAG: hypothetical protein JF886_05785 [Candidatus Dormibacteraeota bacterium]|uniref:Uncharacterized protein n=1 Tax=Candidatus Aeolococcus gillhamiae TaxID=3127015 RepID=A0A934N375_9BACT|nr:hypothetical protein [Candidatus Dormibacteraeota bacterium]